MLVQRARATPRRSATSSTQLRELVGRVPIFGICLGHQLLCRAVGLDTYKLRFGHRGANHPVKDLADRADRDHQPEPRLRGASGPAASTRSTPTSPVRWETDFGAAELTHINLYDRTVEGLRLPRGAAPARSSTTPRRARARTTRCISSTASSPRSAPDAAPRRHPADHDPRLGADRDRPGGRVRLLRAPGLQGARRGGLRGRARQLEPGDDHDRPGVRDRDLHRAAAARARSRRSSRASAPTRCCRRSAARPRSTSPGAARGRHARALRRRADRRRLRRDRARRGPRPLPRDDARPPACACRAARSRPTSREALRRARRRSACRRSCARRSRSAARAAASRARARSYERIVAGGIAASPIGQVLVEESVLGWDEFELEVMRDRNDNVVIVCSIENLDPMGVHTGDSVTVAPQLSLSDEAYQELRDQAIAVIRAVGVETGGSNVQFAVDPADRRDRRDRDEPARLALLGARLEGDRLPDREDRGAARGRLRARRDPQRHHPRRRRRASSRRSTTSSSSGRASRSRSSRRRRRPDDAHEVGRRGDGDRPHVRAGVPEGDALARARRRRPTSTCRSRSCSSASRGRARTATTSCSRRCAAARRSASCTQRTSIDPWFLRELAAIAADPARRRSRGVRSVQGGRHLRRRVRGRDALLLLGLGAPGCRRQRPPRGRARRAASRS